MMQTRTCTKCGEVKPLTAEHFQVDAQKRSGFRPDCKACRHAGYARNAPGSLILRNRALAAQGLKACCACGEAKPFDAFSAKTRAADGLHERCRPCRSAYVKDLRNSDPESFDASSKAWKQRNREKVRERARQYAAQRRADDPKFRLRGAITRLVGCFMKRRGQTKGGRGFFSSVGYTPEAMAAHIERQFLPGMTWANYGEWHVDHIRPNASFDYSSMDDAEFKACWALTNLRPLWAVDNLKKANSIVSLL